MHKINSLDGKESYYDFNFAYVSVQTKTQKKNKIKCLILSLCRYLHISL